MTIRQETNHYSDSKESWSSEDNKEVMEGWGTDG